MKNRMILAPALGIAGAAMTVHAQVSYKSADNVSTGPNPAAVVVADLNGDGKADILTANRGGSAAADDGTLTVQFNVLGAVFAPPVQINSAKLVRPTALAVADFDGDGNRDIAAVILGSDNVTFFLGQGLGTFDTGTAFAVGNAPQAIAVGDLDGANGLDVVVSNDQDDTLSVLLSDDSGAFAAALTIDVGIEGERTQPRGVAIGDFDGDGNADLAAVLLAQNQIAIVAGNGDGTFEATPTFVDVGNDPTALAAADIDGDGDLDLLACNTVGDSVAVAINNGSGVFSASDFDAGNGPAALVVLDLDGDGELDIATANAEGDDVSVLLGNGDGTFDAAKSFDADGGPAGIAAGDLDGSGKLDLVSANSEAGTVSLLFAGTTTTTDDTIDDVTDALGDCAPGCGPLGLSPLALTLLGIVGMKRPRRR